MSFNSFSGPDVGGSSDRNVVAGYVYFGKIIAYAYIPYDKQKFCCIMLKYYTVHILK